MPVKNLSIDSRAKINLTLDIGGLRPDGFHEIDSVFAQLKFGDVLELEAGGALKDLGFETVKEAGLTLAMGFSAAYPLNCRKDILSGFKDNSIFKVWNLLRSEGLLKKAPPLRVILHKTIPTGAGLGGGSSNAAAALVLFKRALSLRLTPARLLALGARVGSDVPFFLKAKSGSPLWRSRGRGEKLSPIKKAFKRFVLVVYPGFGVPTVWAYRELDRLRKRTLTAQSILPRLNSNDFSLPRNSFEPVVFKSHPVLAEAKQFLQRRGAESVSLTGTGSCLFALSQRRELPRQWVDAMRLSKRFAGFHYYATEIDN